MIKRFLSGGLALVCVAAASGCSVEETPERCIERFEELLAGGHPGNDPSFRDARLQPVFTYDITHMDDVLETLVGRGAARRQVHMTISQGGGDAAVNAFYKAEVPPEGAIFAADGISLYRVKGTPGTREETLAAGCRTAPPKATLTRLEWMALPAEDLARTQ